MTIIKSSIIQQANFVHELKGDNGRGVSTLSSMAQNLGNPSLLGNVDQVGAVSDASHWLSTVFAHQRALLTEQPSSSTAFAEHSLALDVLKDRGGKQSEHAELRIHDKGFALLGGMSSSKRVAAYPPSDGGVYLESLLRQRVALQGERAVFEGRIRAYETEVARLQEALGAAPDEASRNVLEKSIAGNRRQIQVNQTKLGRVDGALFRLQSELRALEL